MLIIPDTTKDYFLKTQRWAENHNMLEIFQMSMLSVHLYGCKWTDQDKYKLYLYEDSKFNSFGITAEIRQDNDTHAHHFNKSLTYQGPQNSDEVLNALRTIPHHELLSKIGWRMHT